MRCLQCDRRMTKNVVEERVVVDYCHHCHLYWFDAGELEIFLGLKPRRLNAVQLDKLKRYEESLERAYATLTDQHWCPGCQQHTLVPYRLPAGALGRYCPTCRGLLIYRETLNQYYRQSILNRPLHWWRRLCLYWRRWWKK